MSETIYRNNPYIMTTNTMKDQKNPQACVLKEQKF